MTEIVTGIDVFTMVIKLLDKFTVEVGWLVNIGNVTFSTDEFNCDELRIAKEVVVRTCEVLDKILVKETSVVLFEDTAKEDVPELFTCDVEGTSEVTFDKGEVI